MQIDMIQLLEEAYKEYQLPKNFQKFTQEEAKILLNFKSKRKVANLITALDIKKNDLIGDYLSLTEEDFQDVRREILEMASSSSEEVVDELTNFITSIRELKQLSCVARKNSFSIKIKDIKNACKTITLAKGDIQLQAATTLLIASFDSNCPNKETSDKLKTMAEKISITSKDSLRYRIIKEMQIPKVRRYNDLVSNMSIESIEQLLSFKNENEYNTYLSLKYKIDKKSIFDTDTRENIEIYIMNAKGKKKQLMINVLNYLLDTDCDEMIKSCVTDILDLIDEAKKDKVAEGIVTYFKKFYEKISDHHLSQDKENFINSFRELLQEYSEIEDLKQLEIANEILDLCCNRSDFKNHSINNLQVIKSILRWLKTETKITPEIKAKYELIKEFIEWYGHIDDELSFAIEQIQLSNGIEQSKSIKSLTWINTEKMPEKEKQYYRDALAKIAYADNKTTKKARIGYNMLSTLDIVTNFIHYLFSNDDSSEITSGQITCIDYLLKIDDPRKAKEIKDSIMNLMRHRNVEDAELEAYIKALSDSKSLEHIKIATALAKHLVKYSMLDTNTILKLIAKIGIAEKDETDIIVIELNEEEELALIKSGVTFPLFRKKDKIYLPDHIKGKIQFLLSDVLELSNTQLRDEIIGENGIGHLDTNDLGENQRVITRRRERKRGEKKC